MVEPTYNRDPITIWKSATAIAARNLRVTGAICASWATFDSELTFTSAFTPICWNILVNKQTETDNRKCNNNRMSAHPRPSNSLSGPHLSSRWQCNKCTRQGEGAGWSRDRNPSHRLLQIWQLRGQSHSGIIRPAQRRYSSGLLPSNGPLGSPTLPTTTDPQVNAFTRFPHHHEAIKCTMNICITDLIP